MLATEVRNTQRKLNSWICLLVCLETFPFQNWRGINIELVLNVYPERGRKGKKEQLSRVMNFPSMEEFLLWVFLPNRSVPVESENH